MKRRWLTFLENVVMELRELGGVLILGRCYSGRFTGVCSRNLLLWVRYPITSILAMMLLAVIVSICSTVDSFFALSFASSFTSSSLLAL
ncbi:MAG UNVERIFIED_CONTAM: permease [Microcystis novacekii LVE1205-3]|jgi:uncharacterized membrane protein YraQ (UPF0718 family)